ncbi:MAG: DUF3892 domain-containing protein [Deltaproteobacteria bacterium]|jgi:hypothetical protein|nr:DUF3892 domain-containing protein [Deltaproteobacteria bacterium]MBW2534484.1 DUF3892 domain-containing protein [Deltaproteobacteria bacterium]
MKRSTPFALPAAVLTACLGSGCDEGKPQPPATTTASAAPTASAAAPAGKGIRFGKPVVNVGDKYTTSLQMENSAVHTNKELPGVEEESGFGYELLVQAEVLAVRGNVETKWKLTYDEARMLMIRDGKSTGVPNPIQGKSYIVEQKGEEFVATTADGKPVSDDEMDYVGTPVQSFHSWQIPDRPLEPGAEVPELAKQAEKEPGIDGKLEGRAWFVRRAGSFGIFKRTMKLAFDGGGFTMTCHSTVRISDGRVLVTTCDTLPMTLSRDADSKSTGLMKLTARRQYAGDSPAPLPLPAGSAKASAKPAGASGSFDDVCYGDKELTETQRFHIQEKVDDLDDPCPLWATPKVTIRKEAISVNDRQVIAEDAMPDADHLANLEPLGDRLSKFRKRWKYHRPNEPFPGGPITIEATEGFASAPVISAFVAGWRAGYAKVRLQAGKVTLELSAAVPPAPDGAGVGPALYVEPTGGGKALAGVLKDGPALDPKKEGVALADADRWLPPLCADKTEPPCFDRLVFRLQKVPIEQTLEQLHQLLKPGAFRTKPPEVRFTFRCPKGPSKFREEALAGPWGPREPDKPCF